MAPTFSRQRPDLLYVAYQRVDLSNLLCGTLPSEGSLQGALLDRRSWLFDRITSDPDGLVQAMQNIGMILTGSAALAFALPNVDRRDFDFIIPFGSLPNVISTFAKWGYEVDTSQPEDTSAQGLTPIACVHSITRLVSLNQIDDSGHNTFTSIDIIESRTPNVLDPLFSFHTTASMVFLSSRAFFVAYPEHTLTMKNVESAAYKAPTADGSDLINTIRQYKLLQKYEEKGFESLFYPYPKHKTYGNSLCGKTLRSVHDKLSLYIVLDDGYKGVPEEDTSKDHEGTWHLGGTLQICANCETSEE